MDSYGGVCRKAGGCFETSELLFSSGFNVVDTVFAKYDIYADVDCDSGIFSSCNSCSSFAIFKSAYIVRADSGNNFICRLI